MWILAHVQVITTLTVSLALFVMEDDTINTPDQNSTYPVFPGFHLISGTRIVAKLLNYVTDEERRYADEEASFNHTIKQYTWMRVAEMLDHFQRDKQYAIIFRRVDGIVLSAQAIAEASIQQRFSWLVDVAASLSYCHLHGVFHQDLADLGHDSTINVMVQLDNRICLIDFGDSVFPLSDDEARIALGRDMNGMSNLVHRLFGHLGELVHVRIPDRITKEQCKSWLHHQLMRAGFTPPAGFGGAMAVSMHNS